MAVNLSNSKNAANNREHKDIMNIKTIVRIATLSLAVSAATGCATGQLQPAELGYSIGDVRTASVGEEFLSATYGYTKVLTVTDAIAANFGKNFYDKSRVAAGQVTYSKDYVLKELIYSGRRGDVITVDYREYRGGGKLAAPAFFQTVEYDLGDGKDIYFRNFAFSVAEATNRKIHVVIIAD